MYSNMTAISTGMVYHFWWWLSCKFMPSNAIYQCMANRTTLADLTLYLLTEYILCIYSSNCTCTIWKHHYACAQNHIYLASRGLFVTSFSLVGLIGRCAFTGMLGLSMCTAIYLSLSIAEETEYLQSSWNYDRFFSKLQIRNIILETMELAQLNHCHASLWWFIHVTVLVVWFWQWDRLIVSTIR